MSGLIWFEVEHGNYYTNSDEETGATRQSDES